MTSAGRPATEVVRRVDDRLRTDLLGCWVAVSNAGGAVGFLPPVTAADVAPTLDQCIEEVHAGDRLLVVARDGDALAGFGFVQREHGPVVAHRGVVKALQVHPDHQGRGHGIGLLRALHRAAAAAGLRLLMLYYRDGLGLDEFYRKLGYREVGRLPRSLRVGADDWRDDVWAAVWLDDAGTDEVTGWRGD